MQVKRTNEIGNVYHEFKGIENELEPCWFDRNEEVRVTLFREDGAVAVAFSGAGEGEVACEEELDGVFDEDNKTLLLYFVRFPLLAPWHSFVDERDYRDMVLERLCIEVSFVKHTKPQTRACRLSDAEFMFHLSNTAHITRAESRTELDDEQTCVRSPGCAHPVGALMAARRTGATSQACTKHDDVRNGGRRSRHALMRHGEHTPFSSHTSARLRAPASAGGER